MPTTEPTETQLRNFRNADQETPITMVNLLKFRDKANYEPADSVDELNISGREAYQRYASVALSRIRENGGSIEYLAPSEQCFVGDASDDWDQVVIVRYPSRAAYLRGFDSPEYQAAIHHRIAGLEKRMLLQCAINQIQ